MQDRKTRIKPPREAKAARKPRASLAGGRPRKLTHEGILDAAEALVRDSGSASLTLRSLSARLGVQAPTLYTYFAHLDQIEAAVLGRIVGGIPLPDLARPQPLDEQVVDLFLALRNLQRSSPMALAGAPGSIAWRWTVRASDRLLGIFEAMGADLGRAQLAYRVLSGVALHSAVNGDVEATPEQIAERHRRVNELPVTEAGHVQRAYRRSAALALPAEAGLRAALGETVHLLLPAARERDAARMAALRAGIQVLPRS